ncbi:MAG: hypothetical protein HY555_06270 [Euryarchaeota archaeon]|nr:hypothetical protein [Euryarchaeota archaeon]
MGQVIDSFKSSLVIVRDNPVILGVAFVSGLLGLGGLLWESLEAFSLVGSILYAILFFIGPFFAGGLLGMVVEATEKPTKLSTFIEAGKKNYVSLLKAVILFFAILLGLIIGTGIIVGLPAGVVLILLPKGAPLFKLIFLLFIATIAVAVFLIAMMLIQFYDIGIVVHHYGAWEAFRKSFAFARPRLLSVFYYSLLKDFIGLLFVIPIIATLVYSALQTEAGWRGLAEGPIFTSMSMPSIVLYLLILGTIGMAIVTTFHGVFYLRSQGEKSSSQ